MGAFFQQYEYIKGSRQVLFSYLETISLEDFIRENSSFGRGSIRNLMVHNVNTYQSWIGNRALQEHIRYTEYKEVETYSQLRKTFAEVDAFMARFLPHLEEDPFTELTIDWNGKPLKASRLQLFSHTITHEFHHKGQVLSLSRHLGYIPIDTDIMR